MTNTASKWNEPSPLPIDAEALDALINVALLGAYNLDMSAGQGLRTQLGMMVNNTLGADGVIDPSLVDRIAAKVYEFAAFDLGIEIARRIIAHPLADHRASMRESLVAAITDARNVIAAEQAS